MAWNRKKLRELADENGVIKGKHGVLVKIWPDGSLMRYDVPLDHALKMSVKDAVEALSLKK